MAGKSSKLAQGVNRTGNGLFRGMTAINSVKTEEKETVKESNDISKNEETSEAQAVSASNISGLQTDSVNNADQEIPAQTEENLQDKLQADEKNVREAANYDTTEAEIVHEKATEAALEPQNTIASSEPVQSTEAEHAYEPEPAPAPVREQDNATIREPVPVPASSPVSEPVKRQTRVSEVKDLRDLRADDNASAKSKGSSRYEKEKFLLLDIRGYRDYVEHMAKAANMSATKYIRNLIQQDMDMNMDIYEAHKALEEKLKGRVTR